MSKRRRKSRAEKRRETLEDPSRVSLPVVVEKKKKTSRMSFAPEGLFLVRAWIGTLIIELFADQVNGTSLFLLQRP